MVLRHRLSRSRTIISAWFRTANTTLASSRLVAGRGGISCSSGKGNKVSWLIVHSLVRFPYLPLFLCLNLAANKAFIHKL